MRQSGDVQVLWLVLSVIRQYLGDKSMCLNSPSPEEKIILRPNKVIGHILPLLHEPESMRSQKWLMHEKTSRKIAYGD